jgi:excinuclease UvrABC ATPase subunit
MKQLSETIIVVGAREHNLKNVSVEIPKRKLVVFTGVSGSGKSSLVFDTVYAEAQRQLIETFSSFARRRLPKINRPDVDEIRNISTAINIDQKKMGNNPRSTVGTATEIYTYLRLLFSRNGTPTVPDSRYLGFNNPLGMCQNCKGIGMQMTVDIDTLIDWDLSLKDGAIRHSQFVPGKWSYRVIEASKLFDMDKPLRDYAEEELDKLLYTEKHILPQRLDGVAINLHFEGIVTAFQRRYTNSSMEAERSSEYWGRYFRLSPCPDCGGTRINEEARKVKLNGRTIPELVTMELTELLEYLETVKGPIADPIVGRMKPVLRNLIDIGVGYLSLSRAVGTLSGGESQRVKMARQLGCDLVDLTYIFDEPSVGLHQRDISKLVTMLDKIRKQGNSVLVVEHDPAIIEHADKIIDMGPGAGSLGGRVVFTGTYKELLESESITGRLLTERKETVFERRESLDYMEIKNASIHNLKNITVKIPTGIFVCITGVAGSGKSSLILDEFARRHPDSIVIDQSAVGRSTRSTPGTYIGVFNLIRKVYAKATGTKASLFSFNSKGACPKCKGRGRLKIEMSFLDDVTMTCDECEGRRYNQEVLDLKYRGKSIADILEMTALEAIEFFEDKQILRRLRILEEVGLGYITLGQTVSSLSGGEAQRIKLARELHKKGNIYILDEPTTGLHMADIEKLHGVIERLVDSGNTVLVIEHNLDVIKHADWVIDLGPEGGSKGGEIIAQGTPEEISKVKESYTGQYLKRVL